jgi:phosphoadenosine phosphosulfate reductase
MGFTSVGCVPCTHKPATGDSVRGGRWSGLSKTECGIHLGPLPAPADR